LGALPFFPVDDISDRWNVVLADVDIDPQEYAAADVRKLVLIFGILTVHNIPEGVAVLAMVPLAFV